MAGETSGDLEKVMDQLASQSSTVLEMLMLAILDGIVGLIVLAAMMPMFSIYEGI